MTVIARRIALVVGSLVLLLVLVAAGGYVVSEVKIHHKYDIASESIPIPTDSLSIARGRHLARAMAKCTDCHGEDLGGRIMVSDPAMGKWVTSNLTRGQGGIGGTLRDDDWVRAIRHRNASICGNMPQASATGSPAPHSSRRWSNGSTRVLCGRVRIASACGCGRRQW